LGKEQLFRNCKAFFPHGKKPWENGFASAKQSFFLLKPFALQKPHCKTLGFAMSRKSFAFAGWEKSFTCKKSLGKMCFRQFF